MTVVVRKGVRGLLAAAPLWLGGCYTDAAPVPEPQLHQPGVFVAVADEPGGALTLYRNIGGLYTGDDVIVALRVFDVHPSGPDEARELAAQPNLPIREKQVVASLRQWPADPYWIVWYRSLEKGEEGD
jgi:hypothetical protein